MLTSSKRFIALVLGLLVSSVAVAHTDGIYNPTGNSVGDTQGIDSNAATVAPVGLMLDGITTGIKAAYSTRKLLTAYAGSAIRVQRISDNAQQNIGFSSNVLDTSSLVTFCSGTTGKIITWYDQSGNGFDQTAQAIGTAPIIYQSGATNAINTSRPAILFVAASTDLLQNVSMTANSVNTIFQNAVISLPNATQAITGPSGPGGLEWRVDSGLTLSILSSATLGLGTSTSTISASTGVVVEHSYNASTGAWAFWINAAAAGTGTTTVTFTARTSTIGVNGASEYADGSIGEIVMYDLVGGIPNGSRTSIEANQKIYWGTP